MHDLDQPRLVADVQPDGLLAVHKPAGLPVHPTGDGRETLVEWLERHHPGARPAHRLDLHTSGLVLCAADRTLRGHLGKQFEDRLIQKRYLALVHGRARRKGIIRRPLSDGRRGRALPAVTRYTLISWLGKTSLIRVRPETGRKHQIRRHLHHLGHAIVGDERYRPRRFASVPGFPGRLWLHSAALALPDGRQFEAPLPTELAAHLEHLRAREA